MTRLRKHKNMRDDTKLAQIRQAMSDGDWETALKLASRFQRLGEHVEVITRAANALDNPAFYEEIGYDLGQIREQGIEALKSRYSKSWEGVQDDASNE